MPSRFCTIANADASSRNTSTWRPLSFNSATLALTPMVVKKAIISGACRLVSRVNRVTSRLRATSTASATTRPPITGAGRL